MKNVLYTVCKMIIWFIKILVIYNFCVFVIVEMVKIWKVNKIGGGCGWRKKNLVWRLFLFLCKFLEVIKLIIILLYEYKI